MLKLAQTQVGRCIKRLLQYPDLHKKRNGLGVPVLLSSVAVHEEDMFYPSLSYVHTDNAFSGCCAGCDCV